VAPDREQRHEERNRVLGVPVDADWHGWVSDEQQAILGFPADWFKLPRLGRRMRGMLRRLRGRTGAG
jgi:hypothetical protein